MYAKKSDTELCSLLNQGDQRAFLEIYDRYSPLLQRHAQRKLADPQECEDILQELFTYLWEHRHDLHVATNLGGYLYKALRNRILNHFARRQLEDAHLAALSAYLTRAADATDQKVMEDELAEMIEREIGALPPRMREVFLLHRQGELTYQQIAATTGTSKHTIATQIKKSLQLLRGRLAQYRSFFVFLF